MKTKTIQGNPCKRGHSGLRYVTANGRPSACIECARTAAAARRIADPERAKAAGAAWYAANRERALARRAAWKAANPESHKASSAAWAAANPVRRRVIARNASGRRRAAKRVQICLCCTTAQLLDVYRRPRGTEVDHIVPLALGGLHCRQNLQILTKEEHKAKTRLDRIRIDDARRQRANAQG
jgi:hypothetical protein